MLPALSPQRAAHRDAAARRDPVPVRDRRAVRLLRRAARRVALLPELQQRRVQRPRAGQPSTTNSPRPILLAMGMVFQVPVAILAATRARDRHAASSCARTAATRSSRAPPSPPSCPATPITLMLETVPLYLLYEVSILLASLVARSRGAASARGAAADRSAMTATKGASSGGPQAPGIPSGVIRRDSPGGRNGAERAGADRPHRPELSH
jgi:hypothetical protein